MARPPRAALLAAGDAPTLDASTYPGLKPHGLWLFFLGGAYPPANYQMDFANPFSCALSTGAYQPSHRAVKNLHGFFRFVRARWEPAL